MKATSFTCLTFLTSLSRIAYVDSFLNHYPVLRTISAPSKSFKCSQKALTTDKQLSTPPTTFIDCVKQAAVAVREAISQKNVLLEVEFPPLPLDYLEDSSSSARDIADANTRWALEFAKTFGASGYRVAVIYPDQPELDDAVRFVDMEGTTTPFPNVTMATIRADSIRNAQSLDQIVFSILGATVAGKVDPVANTDLYVAVISSTQELTDLEKLHQQVPNIPIVFFNLRLDILRGDLGLPLFPKRDLQYRFLSKIRPAYLLRSRSFATSIRRPPFVINYSGILFRVFPEPFQSILNTGAGKSRVAEVSNERPSGAAFRKALTASLKIPEVSPEELQTPGTLVWWEKDADKAESDAWLK